MPVRWRVGKRSTDHTATGAVRTGEGVLVASERVTSKAAGMEAA
jgi:hypothetical protein